MKSFFKHMTVLAVKKPLQPIIIMIMIMISVAVFLTSAAMMQSIDRFKYINSTRISGNSDIRITVSENSDKRFITQRETNEILGDRGTSCGFFSFGGYIDFDDAKSAIVGMAADLRTIESFNPIDYSQKMHIPNYAYDEAAIISQALSAKMGLQIGDMINVHMNKDTYQTYLVYGIANDSGIFFDYDVIVDDYSLTRVIFGVIVGSKSEVFYNDMLIKLKDKADYDAVVSDFLDSEQFADKIIGNAAYPLSDNNEDKIMLIVMISMSIFVVIVIYSAFVIFSYNQNHAVSIFKSLGAFEGQLRLLLYAECLIYSTIAGLLGLLVAKPLVSMLSSYFFLGSKTIFISPYQYVLAFFYGVLISVISVTLPIVKLSTKSLGSILSKEAQNYKKPSYKLAIVSLLFSLVIFIILFFVVGAALQYLALLSIIVAIATLCLVLPEIITFAARCGLFIFGKLSRKSNWINISFKQMKTNSRSQNSYRLIAVVSLLFLVSFRALNVIIEITNQNRNVFSSNFISMAITDPNDSVYKKLNENEHVESAIKAYLNDNVQLDRVKYFFVAADTKNLDKVFELSQFEIEYNDVYVDNPLIISEGLAKMKGWGLGDRVEIVLNEKTYAFDLYGIISTRMLVVVTDLADIDENYNAIFIKSNNPSDTVSIVYDNSILSGGVLIETDRFFGRQNINAEGTALGFKVFMVIIAVMAFVGIVNNLAISIIQGKEQKKAFLLLGMSKSRYFAVYVIELCLGIMLCVGLGVAFGYLTIGNLARWLISLAILV